MTKNGKAEPSVSKAQGIVVNAQYLRDFSFENPHAPLSLTWMADNPKIKVDVNVSSRNVQERTWEVTLHLRAHAETGEAETGETEAGEAKTDGKDPQTIFLAEGEYATLVTLGDDIPETAHEQVVLIEVPRLSFPYLRKIVADATQDGGFMPLMVAPPDFVQLYQNRKKSEEK